MIHAYNKNDLYIVKNRLAQLFELATNIFGQDIDDFANIFINSNICEAFETANSIYVMGKSSIELYGLLMNQEVETIVVNEDASSEFWVGWVLAHAQWFLNVSFSALINAIPCSELIMNYFPYHEMDIMHIVSLFQDRINKNNAIKQIRKQRNLTQYELSILSGVPERTIKSYEQNKVDITKAQVDTIYYLSKALGCKMEDLIV